VEFYAVYHQLNKIYQADTVDVTAMLNHGAVSSGNNEKLKNNENISDFERLQTSLV
jgi:hypothetical protein